MSEPSVRQQIVDKLKEVDTVLVTVSSSPTVDELSAALGFTLLVNKLNKHATAVFSGDIPPAITFLDPEKTFENTVNSLRDFIIALDKEKADHLRYKVDGDMVKIFITPYRTTIDDTDLEFSQGDYNVEMVVAIGVKNTDDLDRALTDHGRIMHDATVASLSLGAEPSQLGSLNWHDAEASSLSEMLVGLSEALRKDKNLVDEQIATAYLTGIVAATDRFSNDQTTSKSMTVAAQLMAAGANQQLIASRLEETSELSSDTAKQSNGGGNDDDPVAGLGNPTDSPNDDSPTNRDGTTTLNDNVPSKVKRDESRPADGKPKQGKLKPSEPKVEDGPAADGSMSISHQKPTGTDKPTDQAHEGGQDTSASRAEEILAEGLTAVASPPTSPPASDLAADIKQAAAEMGSKPALPEPVASHHQAKAPQPAFEAKGRDPDMPRYEPTFGGTLNATSEQAAEDKRRAEAIDRNKKILSHGGSSNYVAGQPEGYPAVNSHSQEAGPASADQAPPVQPAPAPTVSTQGKVLQPLSPSPTAPAVDNQKLMEELAGGQPQPAAPTAQADDARSAISQAFQAAPPAPATVPLPPPVDTSATAMPPLPPMPDFSTLPPLPPASGGPIEPSPSQGQEALQESLPKVSPVNAAPAVQPQAPPDPGQFQIPGQ